MVNDPHSLRDLREAVHGRGKRGIAAFRARYDALRLDTPPTREQLLDRTLLEKTVGFLYMYDGEFEKSADWLARAYKTALSHDLPGAIRSELIALLGIVSLRRGEVENCLECIGPSSCIFPLAREAAHTRPEGAREAVRWFAAYLEESPDDLRVIWLLNLAYMALGEYPESVPARFLLPVEPFKSRTDVGRFKNVAAAAGLSIRGPNLAGGSIFDDFNGDGLPDLFTTSVDADRGASLFVNRGDGTFADRSAETGLGEQIYAINVSRTDFDNDGDLDVLLVRGGWEKPARMSLLRNRGDGVFDDVTIASGLAEPIASEAAVWGDYDNDGWLDLFVCGEYFPPARAPSDEAPDPRNRCRLYRNQKDGTFRDVAQQAGVLNDGCAKGAAWGDYDADGHLDLFVSNMGQPCALFHNEGNGTFIDVAPALGVTGADVSFACWFWDYDNDGLLDLYVNDYRASVAEVVACSIGHSVPGSSRPRLYRNLGARGFREVSRRVGLDRPMAPMGANFGDIDNDGFLDIYLGTGDMSYAGLDRKLLLRNMDGSSFEDVTTSSGTGHLQKGHGISFADWDDDGDLDLFVELGGAVPGDRAHNALFQNPGHGRHWLKVKLIGTKTNRAALGASIRVDLKNADGTMRSIYRTVGNNSSFGGNSLVELVGLLDSTSVAQLNVSWPTSRSVQVFREIPGNQSIVITEGDAQFKVLPRQRPGTLRADHHSRTSHVAGARRP